MKGSLLGGVTCTLIMILLKRNREHTYNLTEKYHRTEDWNEYKKAHYDNCFKGAKYFHLSCWKKMYSIVTHIICMEELIVILTY